MSENYTAEDFAKATFARHGDGGRAARFAGDKWPWMASTADAIPWRSDEEMARDGWVPVVEDAASDRIMTLLDTKKTHERVIAELRHDMSLARREIVDLREENDRLERILQAPLSLKDMRVAWENAEQSGECREGDVLMTRHSDDNYEVWVPVGAFDISKKSRVLSRAPKREPWQDLADVLRASLLSDETVERVAHGIHDSHDRGCHFEAEGHAVREEYRAMARAALTAAIGDGDE